MTVKDYQFVKSLDSGSTTFELDLIEYFKIDTTKTNKEVKEELVNILRYEEKEIGQTISINGKEYGIEKDLLSSQFDQFIQLDKILAEDKNVENLHRLLAIYIRPMKRKLFKKVIEPFDLNKQDEIAKDILNMEIGYAINAMVFFYSYVNNILMKNIKISYLNKMKKMKVNNL